MITRYVRKGAFIISILTAVLFLSCKDNNPNRDMEESNSRDKSYTEEGTISSGGTTDTSGIMNNSPANIQNAQDSNHTRTPRVDTKKTTNPTIDKSDY